MDENVPRITPNKDYASFDGMTFPLPGERMNECAWRLRYGKPTEQDAMYAAGILEAYCQLTVIDRKKDRDPKIRQIQTAYKLAVSASSSEWQK